MTDLSFTVPRGSLERALEITRPVGEEISAERVEPAEGLAKVSIVGTGVANTPGYASRMFRALTDADINIQLITTSEIRITCIIAQERIPEAVRALHEAFELERPGA